MTFAHRFLFIVSLLAVGATAGWAANAVGLPLGWITGPLIVTGAATIALKLPQVPNVFRYSGQVVIGAAVGLYLSPEAVERILANAVPIALGTLVMTVAAFAISLAQIRFSATDPATAIFSNIPGGPLDMAMMAERHGGNPDRTAAYHVVRITTVVLIFPPVIMLSSAEIFPRVVVHGSWNESLLLLLLGVTGALVAWRLRIINPFFTGPLLAVGAVTASGANLLAFHEGVVPAAQILYGVSLGGMFQLSTFERAGRFMVSLVLTTVALLASALVTAELLLILFGGDFSTMLLANAPAAVGEMAITAQVLNLDVPLVASFQIARVVIGLFLGTMFFTLYMAVKHRRPKGRSDKPE